MTIAFVFWLIMLLWLVATFYWGWHTDRAGGFVTFAPVGINLIVYLLLFLLGWRVFGWPIAG